MEINYGFEKIFLVLLYSFFLLIAIQFFNTTAYASVNTIISLGKPVTASTQESWNPAENVVDGFSITRWAASSGNYPNWVRIDLGSVSEIYRVDIDWYDPGNRSYKYKLEVSDDDEKYIEVVDQTERTKTGNSSDELNVTARYIKVTVTGGTGSPSFYNFKVFGQLGEATTSKLHPNFEADVTRWVGTWATSPQLVEPNNMPPSPGLSNNTLRQVVRVSIGGSQIRLKFSNQYGTTPLTINTVHFAQSAGGNKIKPDTGKIVTFNGSESVTIPPGQTLISDTLDYDLPKLTNMVFTINFGNVPNALTGHPGSRTTSYIYQGNGLELEGMPLAAKTDHWYVITGIDILADETNQVAVVALGDSITDGRGSTTNMNNRWTDNLANRLQGNEATSNVAVLNHGIGGNSVLAGGLGPTTFSRFDRDVLEQSGVRYLIVLAGVNDIGSGNATQATAKDLITAFEIFIDKAHRYGILVYGATILPFGGSGYYSPLREELRQIVNDWIRTSGQFDAVIDFDLALRDPDEPVKLLDIYDDGDGLHPSVAGYQKMSEIVELSLFTK